MLKQCCVCKREKKGPKAIHFFSKKEWDRITNNKRICQEHRSIENAERKGKGTHWTGNKPAGTLSFRAFKIKPETESYVERTKE